MCATRLKNFCRAGVRPENVFGRNVRPEKDIGCVHLENAFGRVCELKVRKRPKTTMNKAF